MAPFSKKDKISIKSLYECKGYSIWQFITEFLDKGWTNNSIQQAADEVEKVWNCVTRNFRNFRRCNLRQILNKQNCISSNSLMTVLCLNVCRLCEPNIMSVRYTFYLKNCTSSKLAHLNSLFLASSLKDEQLIKKQNLHEN